MGPERTPRTAASSLQVVVVERKLGRAARVVNAFYRAAHEMSLVDDRRRLIWPGGGSLATSLRSSVANNEFELYLA